MRRLARLGRTRFGFDQLDAQAAEIGFDLADASGGDRLALARVGQARMRRLDRLGKLPVLAGEQHLLPAAQLVAETLIPLGLAGLALQRAALLVHFEDDVVDAGEILLRGLQLELGGPTA